MKNAIIVLNYNSEEDTIRYVNEIKDYNFLDIIIVVDNLSTNKDCMEKLNVLKNDKVYVIQSDKNGGYSYGNNVGLRFLEELKEEINVVFISNPDVKVSENAFIACIEELEQNDKTAICSPHMYNGNGVPIRRSAWKIRKPLIDMINSTRLNQLIFYKVFKSGEYTEQDFKNNRLKVEAVTGAFFAIKYNIFKEVRFF